MFRITKKFYTYIIIIKTAQNFKIKNKAFNIQQLMVYNKNRQLPMNCPLQKQKLFYKNYFTSR